MTHGRGLAICGLAVLAFALKAILPVSGKYLFATPEIGLAVRQVMSAAQSFSDGHFLLDFANDYAVLLQPTFLYYTPFSYGFAALIQLATGIDAYNALLALILIITASVVTGIYATSRLLGADEIPSALAAGSLPVSPYFLTDLFARGAIAELSAWAVLPWVMFYLVKFCQTAAWFYGLGLALTGALMIISHKIFSPWAAIFLASFVFAQFGWRHAFRVSPDLLLCLLAALSLSSPYWLNALLISSELKITAAFAGLGYANLSSGISVFLPWQVTDPSVLQSFTRFNLQVGPIVTAAILLGATQRKNFGVWFATIISLLFACSFFTFPMMWVNLPTYLASIQFPYRLLVFATSFGLMLTGVALSQAARLNKRTAYVGFLALFVCALQFWWTAPRSGTTVSEIAKMAAPNPSNDYFEIQRVPLQTSSIQIDRSQIKIEGNSAVASIDAKVTSRYVFPVQYSRHLIAKLNNNPVVIENDSGLASIQIVTGTAEVSLTRIEPVQFYPACVVALIFIAALILRTSPLINWSRTLCPK